MREVNKDDVPNSAARFVLAGAAVAIFGIVAAVLGWAEGYLAIVVALVLVAEGMRRAENALEKKEHQD